jgi:hypothetical protein
LEDIQQQLDQFTEEYDGSSWTGGGNLNTARNSLAEQVHKHAGLAFGGFGTALTGVTEEYDGSAWTVGGTLNTARNGLAGCGTQTAGLAFGGNLGGSNTKHRRI